MTTFYGFDGVVQLTPVRGWDPRSGWTITRRYRGLPDAIENAIPSLQADGCRMTVEEESPGGYQIINATFGAEETQPVGEPLADLWDLVGNDIEKSLWLCPLVKAEMDKLYVVVGGVIDPVQIAGRARLKADLDALARGETLTMDSEGTSQILTLDYILTFILAVCPTFNIEVIKKLLASFSLGIESYVVSQWVLRHRLVLAKNSTILTSTTNIDHVFLTTDNLKTSEIVDSSGIPVDPASLGLELPDGQWLKKTPTREQQSADRWQIVQEYWHADYWNPLSYPPAA